MRSSLRRNDIISRYGGEEFLILVPSVSLKQVSVIAEKLRSSVEQHPFGDLPRITVSLGYTVHVPGENVEAFIRRADVALYEAKNGGRNMVRSCLAEAKP